MQGRVFMASAGRESAPALREHGVAPFVSDRLNLTWITQHLRAHEVVIDVEPNFKAEVCVSAIRTRRGRHLAL